MTEDKSTLSSQIRKLLNDSSVTTKANPLIDQQVKDAESDRELKEKYAKWFVWILIAQLIVMNVVFVFAGAKILEFEEWTLNLYMAGTLAEVFGIVLVITKNLFPTKKN